MVSTMKRTKKRTKRSKRSKKSKKSEPINQKSDKDVELKASLTHTRKIIAQKFRKLHRRRMLRERKRERNLTSLKDSLKGIVSQKEVINRNRNRGIQNEAMEIDPVENDEFILPENPPTIPPLPRSVLYRNLPPTPPQRNSLQIDTTPRIRNFFDNIIRNADERKRPSNVLEGNDIFDTSNIRNDSKVRKRELEALDVDDLEYISDDDTSKRNSKIQKRKRTSSAPSEIDIFDVSNYKKNSKIRKHEIESLDFDNTDYNSDDGAVGGIGTSSLELPNKSNTKSRKITDVTTEDDGNISDGKRNKRLLKNRERQQIHENAKKLSLSVVSPDDYDDFGEYRGPGVKRSKIELHEQSINSTMKRLKSQQLLNELNRYADNKTENELDQQFNRYIEYLKAVSPQDFNDDGDFIGTSTRRLELSALATKLNDSKNSRVRKRKLKTGATLKKSFIPYNQNIVYEYYDDPNELCDRLRLLIASKGAGNTNHDQEVNSIIEELRERGIIF